MGAIGAHQACAMLPSAAPAWVAISRPSPVLVGTPAAASIGPRRCDRTSASFHSNPPVARITPRRAPTVTSPAAAPAALSSSVLTPAAQSSLVLTSAVGAPKRTPVTRPRSVTSRRARAPVRTVTPASRHPASSDPTSASPMPHTPRSRRSAITEGGGGSVAPP